MRDSKNSGNGDNIIIIIITCQNSTLFMSSWLIIFVLPHRLRVIYHIFTSVCIAIKYIYLAHYDYYTNSPPSPPSQQQQQAVVNLGKLLLYLRIIIHGTEERRCIIYNGQIPEYLHTFFYVLLFAVIIGFDFTKRVYFC